MNIRTRLNALEAKQGTAELIIAQPWTQHGPATPGNPPTEAEIEAHHAALRRALQNPRAVIVCRITADDPWRVKPILDADRQGKQIRIQRSYGQTP